MAKLNDLKTVIDEELKDITVSERLKNLTMRRIFKKGINLNIFSFHVMKFATSLSSFVLIFLVAFNALYTQSKTQTKPEVQNLSINNPDCQSDYFITSKSESLTYSKPSLPSLDTECIQNDNDKKG